MKVIKHGNTYNKTSCPKCNAVFSYTKKDINYKNTSEEFFGEWYHTYIEHINCPECNTKIKLKYQLNGKDVE